MKTRFRFNILFITLVCTGNFQALFAQEISYRHINTNEGLPSSEVYSILQDSKGYLWVSTDAGVCRFNGRSFTYFTTANGLKDNVVFHLFEDRKGRIWMICYNGSVCYYEHGKISSIAASDSLRKILKNGLYLTSSSAMDTGDTLWLGTRLSLFKIPPKDNYRQVIRDTLFNDSSSLIIKVFNNRNWVISSSQSKIHYEKKKHQTITAFHDCLIQSKGICNFTKWIYDNPTGDARCLYLKDSTLLFTTGRNLYVYSKGRPLQKKTFSSYIIFLGQDRNNNLWIGFSKEGAFRYTGGNLNSVPVQYFQGKSVSDVLCDNEGGIWFSTNENGIYYAPMINYSVYQKSSPLNEKICGLDALGTKVFVSNSKNQIFMINSNHTIDWLNPTGEEIASRSTKFYNYNGKFFVAGNKAGEVDTVKKTIHYFKDDLGFMVSNVALIPLQATGYYLNLNSDHTYIVKNRVAKLTPSEVPIFPSLGSCMVKTSDGVTHIGTRNGLYRYLEDKKCIIPEFINNPIIRQSIITCMEEDHTGTLLVGTKQNGLLLIKNGKCDAVGTAQGLASNLCTAILPDTNQTIWAGGNKGVSLLKINPNGAVSVIATINTSHGLPSNEITRLARKDNILYVGTKEGLCEIDVSQPFYNSTPSPIYLRSIYVDNNPIEPNLHSTFEYNRNNFRFYIDCISFKNMFSPSYYFRLIGQDTTFQKSSSEFIECNNLPPGNYRLEVMGLNNNLLSSTPAIYSFSINSPFWWKGWFILVEILSGAGLIFSFLMLRLNAIRKKEEEKTKINTLISESQMTALRSQMNPHFIFNSINSIQNYILKQDTQKAYDYLAKFSKLIRMVLSNSKENMNTIEQELATLSLYVELEQLRFEESFDFLITFDNTLDIENYTIPGMLLQPFVENAIWHGIMPLEGKRRGKITVYIESDRHVLTIRIEDNGVGRKSAGLTRKLSIHKSIGMSLSKNRLTLLNKLGNKLPYDMVIEDLLDDTQQPAGTKVTLTIPILLQDEN